MTDNTWFISASSFFEVLTHKADKIACQGRIWRPSLSNTVGYLWTRSRTRRAIITLHWPAPRARLSLLTSFASRRTRLTSSQHNPSGNMSEVLVLR